MIRHLARRSLVAAGAIAALSFGTQAGAQAPTAIPLWTSGAPGALGTTPDDQPTITPYLPPSGTATGAAVVIFPGGGYEHLATEKEGVVPAHWLNSLGVSAFVVKYRLGPRYHHPAMLEDAQRAVRFVRANAAQWHVDPARIAVLGFSAGGHMASTAGTHFDAGDSASTDPVQRVSSRPDLMILLYPVITMSNAFTHHGSRVNLLGANPPSDLVWQMSNETQVTPHTAPAFLVATTDDGTVPVENSLAFYQALHAAGVPVEMHLFEHGAHGFGLAPGNPDLSSWTTLCEHWLKRHGWLDARGM